MQSYDAKMRTTVNIDEQLLAEVKAFAARQHRTIGDVIADSLRVTLAEANSRRPPVEIPTYGDPNERPLVDILDKEALAEVLGDNEWPRRDDADS
jgi:hypothetical protein